MPAALRHLALRCRDMEKSRQFYEEVIGWKFVDYRPSRQGLDLSDGTNNITLIQHPREAERRAAEEHVARHHRRAKRGLQIIVRGERL